jgi:FtsH-binding integral membrane protein
MRQGGFRLCMFIGALALLGVAIYYFSQYGLVVRIALSNSGLQPDIKETIQALWLAFASQGLLIGLLYLLVSYKTNAVSREVIVLLGLVQLVEAVLVLTFAGSKMLALALVAAAVFVLIGAVLWPKRDLAEEPEDEEDEAAVDVEPSPRPPGNN